MPALSAAQQAVFQAESREEKLLVTVGLPTPLYWCSGQDRVTHGGHLYLPRPLQVAAPTLQNSRQMSLAVMVADHDAALYRSVRDDKADWKGIEVAVTILGRLVSGAAWTELTTLSYRRVNCEREPKSGWMRINLMGGAGLNPAAGLEEGSRTLFRFPPTPITAIRVGDGSVSFQAGPRSGAESPGGEDDGYVPPSGRVRIVNGQLWTTGGGGGYLGEVSHDRSDMLQQGGGATSS